MGSAAISVVILAGGRVAQLAGCLRALQQGVRAPDAVIVVDNDATKGVRRLLERMEGSLPILRIEGPRKGYAEARNRGVASATTPLIAFLDDDCYADRYWLERMVDSLSLHEAVGGIVLPFQKHRTPGDFPPEMAWLAGMSPPGLLEERVGSYHLPSTSNLGFHRMLWERSPFQEIGGHLQGPESGGNYSVGREDAHWWRSVRRAGARTAMRQDAIVWHDVPAARFRWASLIARAERDGAAHWRRETPRQELQDAVRDIVHAPARVMMDAISHDRPVRELRRLHGLWAARQRALVEAAVDDPSGVFPPQQRTKHALREACAIASHLLKLPVRNAAVMAHHEFRRTHPLSSPQRPPRAVTVVNYNFLGDAVLSLPMIAQLAEAFPDARLTVLCGPVGAPIFRASTSVDQVAELPEGLSIRSPRAYARVARALAATQPDLVLVTYFHTAPPVPLFASTDAPVICWERDQGFRRQLPAKLATCAVPKSLCKPEPAALLDLLAPLGIKVHLERPRFTPPPEACSRVAELMQRRGIEPMRFAVIPLDGTPGHEKFWPVDRWSETAAHLLERHGLSVVFTGTRTGRALFEGLNVASPRVMSCHGMLDAAELAALYAQARVVVGVDSGPAHVAQAVGTPTLVLFGVSDDRRWGPMPRLASDGARPLPFRAVRADDAPFDIAPHERSTEAQDMHFQRLGVEKVRAELDSLIEQSAHLFV